MSNFRGFFATEKPNEADKAELGIRPINEFRNRITNLPFSSTRTRDIHH